MSTQIKKAGLRKALVAAILPFAALGVVGCDNTEPADDGMQEEMPMESEMPMDEAPAEED